MVVEILRVWHLLLIAEVDRSLFPCRTPLRHGAAKVDFIPADCYARQGGWEDPRIQRATNRCWRCFSVWFVAVDVT